jgi:predicted DNA-binding WGR domain protein
VRNWGRVGTEGKLNVSEKWGRVGTEGKLNAISHYKNR